MEVQVIKKNIGKRCLIQTNLTSAPLPLWRAKFGCLGGDGISLGISVFERPTPLPLGNDAQLLIGRLHQCRGLPLDPCRGLPLAHLICDCRDHRNKVLHLTPLVLRKGLSWCGFLSSVNIESRRWLSLFVGGVPWRSYNS